MNADTAADDLVTEEMVEIATRAMFAADGNAWELTRVGLRAVAPLIAERVAEVDAQIANSMDIYGHIAADIRARWEGRP
jgi:hypothetical protein